MESGEGKKIYIADAIEPLEDYITRITVEGNEGHAVTEIFRENGQQIYRDGDL